MYRDCTIRLHSVWPALYKYIGRSARDTHLPGPIHISSWRELSFPHMFFLDRFGTFLLLTRRGAHSLEWAALYVINVPKKLQNFFWSGEWCIFNHAFWCTCSTFVVRQTHTFHLCLGCHYHLMAMQVQCALAVRLQNTWQSACFLCSLLCVQKQRDVNRATLFLCKHTNFTFRPHSHLA